MSNKNDRDHDTLQSCHPGEKTTDTSLIRVMALHAPAYCEQLLTPMCSQVAGQAAR